METPIGIKCISDDNFQVEFEVLSNIDFKGLIYERRKTIVEGIQNIESQIKLTQEKIDELNVEIDKLTNHADGLDYTIAVATGIITGLIDSFFVGELNLADLKAESNKQVNNFIMKFAKLKGYEGKRLNGAIDFLETKYPVLQDNIWKGKKIGVSAKNHHLADLAHHPTLLGLAASIIVQFIRLGIFVNKDGEWCFEFIDTNPKELLKIWLPVIITALFNWLVSIVESNYEEKMGEEIPEPIRNLVRLLASTPMAIEILKVANNWIGHLVSDMGGSKNTAGGGMGIPGLFISLMHEVASLPILRDTGLPKIVNDLYVKNKVDLRTELAVVNHFGKQAIPVIIGELLVRSFYFVRHLVEEVKIHNNLKEVNWHRVIPIGNRTVERMITISSGTFMAVDLADAAIRSATNPTSVSVPTFLANMVLRVNFVGVGRFAIAVVTDVGMGIKKKRTEKERIELMSEIIELAGIKVYYRDADVMCAFAELHEREALMYNAEAGLWKEVGYTHEAMEKLFSRVNQTSKMYVEAIEMMDRCFDEIEEILPDIDEKNPGLLDKILRRL